MVELDKKIGHKIFMSIPKLFMDRDELDHIVDQAISDMDGIGDVSTEGGNGMNQLFTATLLLCVSAVI